MLRPTITRTVLTRTVAPLLLAAALAPHASPCVNPPLTSPGVCIDTTSITALPGDRFQVNIYVKGYTLFGASPGHFCGCALNLPLGGKLCEITGATVVFAGTNVPVPGFDNWDNTAMGANGWNLVKNGNWYAFVAPVVLPIATGAPVDLCFTIVGKVEPPPPPPPPLRRTDTITQGPGILPGFDLVGYVVAAVTDGLADADVGTDEADATGAPINTHQGLLGLGTVTAEALHFHNLGGGVPGTNGPLVLASDGLMNAAGGGSALVMGALGGQTGILAFGLSAVNLPYFGGTFVPSPDVVLALVPDASGNATVRYPAMPGAIAGTEVWFQFWQNDPGAAQGQAGTNALLTTIQR